MAKSAATATSSLVQNLRRFIKKPWEITGPCAHPEYLESVPKATEYRIRCPATIDEEAIVPTADPENVYNILYHARDQHRNRPQIKRYLLKKDDVAHEKKTFEETDLPRVYLTTTVEEDENARGGGYE
ncbi:hypothetical protein HID58_004127 [Brassica napus]|uniref:Uncharacterized protein n=1 Tax=Brassica napus TaxID=3708 RepID=A0ABQ8E7P0_BRANA|nr:uncharacterized protein LOC106422732 [Brassica napus]XP_048603234.1 uncharacterized protein LOC106422732 [Brassica napus]KAH0936666.1 hypothetical protein HID58_004127 [Brassica napus]